MTATRCVLLYVWVEYLDRPTGTRYSRLKSEHCHYFLNPTPTCCILTEWRDLYPPAQKKTGDDLQMYVSNSESSVSARCKSTWSEYLTPFLSCKTFGRRARNVWRPELLFLAAGASHSKRTGVQIVYHWWSDINFDADRMQIMIIDLSWYSTQSFLRKKITERA
jgi:hypothetical protein